MQSFDKWTDCPIVKDLDVYQDRELSSMSRFVQRRAKPWNEKRGLTTLDAHRLAIKRFFANKRYCKWCEAFRNRFCRACEYYKDGTCNG